MQIKFKWLSNQWRRRPQNEIKVDSKSAWQSSKRIKHFDVWTSDWTIKRTIQWMEEELINEWMIYWTNERTNGRTKDRTNERTNTWTNEQTKTVVYKGNRFKETGTFDTKVYFKPTDTLKLLHKKSHHPNHTFKGLIKGRTIWFLGGGGLDYYFQLCFFFWKISTQFFFLAPTLKQTFFLSLEKNKTFFCDSHI